MNTILIVAIFILTFAMLCVIVKRDKREWHRGYQAGLEQGVVQGLTALGEALEADLDRHVRENYYNEN